MESYMEISDVIAEDNAAKLFECANTFAEFSKDESRDVLTFYEAETVGNPSTDGEPATQLKSAERECLEARAAYILRDSIVESVLITDPVLKAVHSGAKATSAERALHPLIDRRDTLAIAHTNVSASLNSISKALTLAEAKNIGAMAKGREVTATLVDLAERTKKQRTDALLISPLSSQLEGLQRDTRTARTRWRIMKSVVGAVIVGSGIDWAANEELRDLVIDEEEDGEGV